MHAEGKGPAAARRARRAVALHEPETVPPLHAHGACAERRFYVSDGYGNACVHKYSPDGKHLLSWGEPGTAPGQFNLPHNICCDADGWVYVADRESHRVQIFDGNGRYEAQWNNLHRRARSSCRQASARSATSASAAPR